MTPPKTATPPTATTPTVHDVEPAAALAGYRVHEAANLFPMIDADSLRALAEDIATHGQQEPIWTYDGQLLDGRNRVVACAMAGKTPIEREWTPREGQTPATFVMSRNVHRRHLTASQRAALAVELESVITEENRRLREQAALLPPFSHATKATVPDGPAVDLAQTPTATRFTGGPDATSPRTGQRVATGRVRDKAAQTMKVSAGYVNDAKDLKRAAPDAFERVKSGELSLTRAQDLVVAQARDQGTLDEVTLRPGAVRAAMGRLEAAEQPKPARLPKATKVKSSATTLALTVTFGNQTVAQEWLDRLQAERKVLHLRWEEVPTPPQHRRRRR